MKNIIAALLLTLMPISAMAEFLYKPVPDGYKGPTAIVRDTFEKIKDSKANIFFVSHIDGRKVYDGLMETKRTNYGKGMTFSPAGYDRQVLPKQTVFSVVARTEYSAKVFSMMKDVYEVKGQITFTPEPDRSYSVHGMIGDDYSAVWIEEDFEGKMMGQKVEFHGSAKVGFFER